MMSTSDACAPCGMPDDLTGPAPFAILACFSPTSPIQLYQILDTDVVTAGPPLSSRLIRLLRSPCLNGL
ncbi:Hypothetical predicted protein [Pelobates cultripes]|uniref:Uncharacterized protein n=1 Tax=Pelobates cultripes TaxID=61616 RepID=A0AAD1WKE9_PELCU|nr:Hypothetical predicted protein [Pelobates cultripes]